MATKLKAGIIILLTVMSNLTSSAQPNPDQQLTPLQNIFRLEGYWKGEATLNFGGNLFQFIYHTDFRPTSDGSGLTMSEWFDHPDLGSLRGSNLIGFNANDQKIHWFSVDNFGTTHDHLGVFRNKNHFYMEANEVVEGQQFQEKIDLHFIGDNKLELKLVATLDGVVFEEITARFTRQPTN